MCMKKQCTVSGQHWGSWNISPVEKGGTTVHLKGVKMVNFMLCALPTIRRAKTKSLVSTALSH